MGEGWTAGWGKKQEGLHAKGWEEERGGGPWNKVARLQWHNVSGEEADRTKQVAWKPQGAWLRHGWEGTLDFLAPCNQGPSCTEKHGRLHFDSQALFCEIPPGGTASLSFPHSSASRRGSSLTFYSLLNPQILLLPLTSSNTAFTKVTRPPSDKHSADFLALILPSLFFLNSYHTLNFPSLMHPHLLFKVIPLTH